jgi:hypothetical protein
VRSIVDPVAPHVGHGEPALAFAVVSSFSCHTTFGCALDFGLPGLGAMTLPVSKDRGGEDRA